MSVTVLQIHKKASYEFRYIQDKYAISPDTKVFALADGTTQSFNSEIWAEIITVMFVENPTFIPNEIIKFFKKSIEQYKNSKFEFSINPAKASLEKSKQSKGATATFMGLHFLNERKVELISCGDSNSFLLSSNNQIYAYPFADLNSLDSNNTFINTESLLQGKVDISFFKVKSFECQYGDKIILATDALSRLLIKTPSALNELLEINDFDQFHIFCTNLWDNKELQEDDISAIILTVDDQNDLKTITPPKGFFFPKEKEVELKTGFEITFTDMQINEIRNQFNKIASDFGEIKKKQKFHEMLIMTAVSLLLINSLYFLFFEKKPATIDSENKVRLQQQIDFKEDTIRIQQNKIDKLKNDLQIRNTQETDKENGAKIKTDTLVPKINAEESKTLKAEHKPPVKQGQN